MESLIVFVLTFLLPSQFAYHFWPQFSYILGLRVDYISPTIFLTDILIILLVPYLIKLVKRFSKKRVKKLVLFFIFLLVFSLLNIVFADSPPASLFKWIAVFKFILLGFYFYLCNLQKLRKTVTLALSSSLITFSAIGLLQFVLQRTVGGPLMLLGERTFSLETPGIALMNFFGKSTMRAYSTFSHPNSFAGFVVVSFFLVLFLNPAIFKRKPLVFACFLVFAVALPLLLTASFNALLGILVVAVFLILLNKHPRFIERIKTLLPALLIVASIIFGMASLGFLKGPHLSNSVKERIILAGESIKVFSKEPILGIGLNNFFAVTKKTQPPHNVFLIILSEAGIAGILLVFFLLFSLLKRNLNIYLFFTVIFILMTSFFDHYWFTLQQNQLLLSLLVGLSARKSTSDKENLGKYNT